jgi:hypothetical protein
VSGGAIIPLCWKAWHKIAVSSAKSLATATHHYRRVRRLGHISRQGRRVAGSSILKPIGVCTVIAASMGGIYMTSHAWPEPIIKAQEKPAANPVPQHPNFPAATSAMETPSVLGTDPSIDLQVYAGLSPLIELNEITTELPQDPLLKLAVTVDLPTAVPEPDGLTAFATALILLVFTMKICRPRQQNPYHPRQVPRVRPQLVG